MSERETLLLAAAENMHDAWRAWSENKEQELLTEEFSIVIQETLATYRTGDVPERCRDLAIAMGQLDAEWIDYAGANGTGGYASQQRPMPRGSFWGAMEKVFKLLKTAQAPVDAFIEPVSLLIEQKVSHRQIAEHIYGYRGEGPFIINGAIRSDLILKEAAQPGSVVPEGWIHPEKRARLNEQAAREARILAAYKAKTHEEPPAKESVQELLRQGVFPKQIALMKHIPVQEVYEEAKRLNISVTEKPNLQTLRAPQEPELPEAQANLLRARNVPDEENAVDDVEDEAGDPEDDDGAEPQDKSIDEIILDKHAEGMSAKDIAEECGVGMATVGRVLRELGEMVEEEEAVATE